AAGPCLRHERSRLARGGRYDRGVADHDCRRNRQPSVTDTAEGRRASVPVVLAGPDAPFPGAHDLRHQQELNLLQIGAILARHWTLAAGFPVGSCALVGIVLLVGSPTFTATTTFVPAPSHQPLLPSNL